MSRKNFITTHSYLFSIVLVYHLIQNNQSSYLVSIIFRIETLAQLSNSSWSFQVRNITGVIPTSTCIRGMERALKLLYYVLENWTNVSIHSHISTERFNLQSPQVYLLLLHFLLKINRLNHSNSFLKAHSAWC